MHDYLTGIDWLIIESHDRGELEVVGCYVSEEEATEHAKRIASIRLGGLFKPEEVETVANEAGDIHIQLPYSVLMIRKAEAAEMIPTCPPKNTS